MIILRGNIRKLRPVPFTVFVTFVLAQFHDLFGIFRQLWPQLTSENKTKSKKAGTNFGRIAMKSDHHKFWDF